MDGLNINKIPANTQEEGVPVVKEASNLEAVSSEENLGILPENDLAATMAANETQRQEDIGRIQNELQAAYDGEKSGEADSSKGQQDAEKIYTNQEMFNKIAANTERRDRALAETEKIYNAYENSTLDLNLLADQLSEGKDPNNLSEHNREIYVANLITRILHEGGVVGYKNANILTEEPTALNLDYSALEAGDHSSETRIAGENGDRLRTPVGTLGAERVLSKESQDLMSKIASQIQRFNALKERVADHRKLVRKP